MNLFKNAAVYWIHLPEHTNINTQGYIGVSKYPEKRWQSHLKGALTKIHYNQHLTNAINKYSWDNLIKEIVLNGQESYCYEIESLLRPVSYIGWNIKPGGNKFPTKAENPEFWKIREKTLEEKYQEWLLTEEGQEVEWAHFIYEKREAEREKDRDEQIKLYGYVKYG